MTIGCVVRGHVEEVVHDTPDPVVGERELLPEAGWRELGVVLGEARILAVGREHVGLVRQQDVHHHELGPRLVLTRSSSLKSNSAAARCSRWWLGGFLMPAMLVHGRPDVVVCRAGPRSRSAEVSTGFSSAIRTGPGGREPVADVDVSIAVVLEEPAHLVVLEHLVDGRRVIRVRTHRRGHVVEIGQVERRREGHRRPPVVRAGMLGSTVKPSPSSQAGRSLCGVRRGRPAPRCCRSGRRPGSRCPGRRVPRLGARPWQGPWPRPSPLRDHS